MQAVLGTLSPRSHALFLVSLSFDEAAGAYSGEAQCSRPHGGAVAKLRLEPRMVRCVKLLLCHNATQPLLYLLKSHPLPCQTHVPPPPGGPPLASRWPMPLLHTVIPGALPLSSLTLTTLPCCLQVWLCASASKHFMFMDWKN